jgi:Zn-dependent M28 family amino/carboxypeptidase
MHHRKALTRFGALAVVAGCLAVASPASAALDEVNTKRLRDAVTVNGILGHERVLQSIANMNGGTRSSGTPGYDASAAYVKRRLEAAGYEVSEQEFTFPFFRDIAPPELQQVTPNEKDYATATLQYSGSGDVTADLVPTTDVQIPPGAEPNSSNSGCEASDFPAEVSGNVALIQRGTCDFETKARNAQEAGATAVIIFNEGQPGRTELIASGTLNVPDFTIPVVGASFADGQELYELDQDGDVTVRVFASTESNLEARATNILADTPAGNPDEVVVVGAHLDSVPAGPGINDNGSGTAAQLEVALQMAKLGIQPRRKLRFAFWGAEEFGLLGSEHYVANLGDELSTIYANLNFDMVGSPNYVRFVYDGDNSAFPPSDTVAEGPPGSAQIEGLFNGFFAGQGMATDPTAFDGRSDYGPFIAVGVPAGGLFTGAEGIKTEAQAQTYGGTAGIAYDPNYHQAGDTIANLSTKALSEMSDGVAHATMTLARSRGGLFEDGSRALRRQAVSKDYQGGVALR